MTTTERRETPALSRRQVEIVRESFAALEPIRETAATLFYARLFELAPEVRPLFSRDLSAQGMKLMAALAFVVRNLDRIEAVRPEITALSLRHVGYGATGSHYSAVGEALLWTLEQGLGDRFTAGVREAWAAAYAMLAETMISVARTSDPAA